MSCIDTGIGRVGVPYHKQLLSSVILAARKSVSIQGTMMTFTEDPDFDKEQLRRFHETCASLEKRRYLSWKKARRFPASLSSSIPRRFLDMVRAGLAIYGIYSENEFRHTAIMDLRTAVSLKARVIYVKRLRKGDSAGYNRAYMAKDDVWVATLPVGHADGLARVAALNGDKGAKVRINNIFIL